MERITPNDIRYCDLAQKRFNKCFSGKPGYILLPTSTKEIIEAVKDAINTKRRPVVGSGGYCLEGFVTDPAVQVPPNGTHQAFHGMLFTIKKIIRGCSKRKLMVYTRGWLATAIRYMVIIVGSNFSFTYND
jgi:hypothetical protein